MILAAGRGERMMPLTGDLPKPLLEVNGKSLIEHQIERLTVAGIVDIVINVSYLGQQIIDALGDGSRYGVSLAYSREKEPLETAGAILCAKTLLGSKPFLLLNADIWTDYSLQGLKCVTLGKNKHAHLVLIENPSHNPGGDYYLDGCGNVGKKENNESTYTFSGLSVLDPGLVYAYAESECDIGEKCALRDVFSWAISRGQLQGEVYSGSWCDVGTPERLKELNLMVGQ